MNVLTDKFSFSDGFVFIDSKTAKIDWDEMDLQLFDSTAPTIKPVQPDITKEMDVDKVKEALGLPTVSADPLTGYGEGETIGNAAWTSIASGSSTASGASKADLDKPLELWLSNDDAAATQVIDLSTYDGVKEVHLYDGAQDLKFNSKVSGNIADVTADATGDKNITLGGGDLVVVAMEAGAGNVNVKGGAGADSIVVQDAAPVTFDMSSGGADKVVTMAEAEARVTLKGYDASTNTDAAIVVQEEYAGDLAAAVISNKITFDDGAVVINDNATTSSAKSKIDVSDSSDTKGWIVNLEGPGEDADKQIV